VRVPVNLWGEHMKPINQQAIDQTTLQRRKLLGAAGTTGALVAAATLLATRQEPSEAVAHDASKPASAQPTGYQVTGHVLRYYQTAKV
jgi:cysteine synthase